MFSVPFTLNSIPMSESVPDAANIGLLRVLALEIVISFTALARTEGNTINSFPFVSLMLLALVI